MMERSDIANRAADAGLLLLGIVPLVREEKARHFRDWLARGWHAGMRFFEQSFHTTIREEPRELLEGARSALVFALPYRQDEMPAPKIAQYARLPDYHKHFHKKIATLMSEVDPTGPTRALTDSAPLLERALAARTLAGFIGKNTMYIHPQWGSYTLLGVGLSTQVWPYDEAAQVAPDRRTPDGGCGSCRRCQIHCPTGALREDYALDARRCLAYYSIEHRGAVPWEYWRFFSEIFFGCDRCQSACPYNRGVPTIGVEKLRVAKLPDLFAIATMDQRFYEERFGGTPMTRAKRVGLRRNAFMAMVATRDRRVPDVVAQWEAEGCPILAESLDVYRAHQPQ